MDYSNKGLFGVLGRGLSYSSKKSKEKFEKEIDQRTIDRGLGWQLFDWSNYILQESNADEKYKEDVESCLKWINGSKELTKVVSVTSSTYVFSSKIHPISRLRKLGDKLNGYLYGQWSDGKGVLGVSPEPLY